MEKETMAAEMQQAVDAKRLQEWTKILQDYMAGKKLLENRVINSEQWWKLRNAELESEVPLSVEKMEAGSKFRSRSAWLHNVIVSKHADAVQAYPEAVFFPREPADRGEAERLRAIMPVVLKQNRFEKTWSKAWYRKLKFGTAIYKVVWDSRKLGGLGDIGVESVSVLNVFWEPGVEDIQESPYFFHTEMADKEDLARQYPQVKDELNGKGILISHFFYDDRVKTDDKVTVIEVYYHKRGALHYCKYVGTTVLYATENDPELVERGLYDHGKYPYVFDALFPVEGSPCGYGFVDICKNPQTEIDLLNTAFLKNAMAGATPRYMVRQEGGINEEELLDLSKAVVHTTVNLGEDSVRVIDYQPLQGNYINVLEGKIMEMRETSGNTETATGSTASGVTAASAIAALQEASGKGSRDAIAASYDVFSEMVELCVELIRQFYTAPRKFRITGQQGEEQFVTYSNAGLQPQAMDVVVDGEQLMRLPVFDLEIAAQKQNAYSTIANNEMALQFFQLGFFDPARVDQTLLCLEMMDFRGKQEILQKVQKLGTIYDRMQMLISYAGALAAKHADAAALQQVAQIAGVPVGGGFAGGEVDLQSAAGGYEGKKEHAVVEKSRKRAQEASQPEGGQ